MVSNRDLKKIQARRKKHFILFRILKGIKYWIKTDEKWVCVICKDPKPRFKTFKEFQVHFLMEHSLMKYINK